MLNISAEIENEFIKLKDYKKKLLSNFYKFNDFEDDEIRINILNLINNFNESLIFLKSELQFEYDLDLTKPIRTHDTYILSYVSEFDKLQEFLTNFKQNFINKQLEIKQNYLQRFQESKAQKYNPEKLDTGTFSDNKSTVIEPITTNAKVISTTKKITSKLAQSSQILQSSLVQSQLNMEELIIQSDSLTYLSDKYSYLRGVLEKSDGFIKDIRLSSERDKKKMYYALVFFGLCVLRAFWRRLFKLPVFFVLKLMFYTFKLVFATMGILSPKSVQEVDSFSTMGTDISLKEYATISTTSSISTPVFTTSASEIKDDIDETIVSIKTGSINSKDSVDSKEDREFDEALNKIFDEL